MKQCPQCRTTYTDDTLKFCLADGALLSEVGEEVTAVRPVRVDIEPPRTVTAGNARPGGESGGFPFVKLLIVLLVLGFLGLVVVGGAGVLFYMNSGGSSALVTQKTPTPTPRPAGTPSATPSATPDADTDQERLEKEIANALKKLEDELKSDANRSAAPPPKKDDVSDGRPTARVNSPGDGFLALRDEPDAETGERLAKIPHGAVVALENCEKQQTTVAGRTGRWCMVTYQGRTGYVFDAWLQYQ